MNDPLKTVVSTIDHAGGKRTYPSTIGEILSAIKGDKFKVRVGNIRARFQAAVKSGADGKSAVRAMKLKLPAVMFSGRFSKRVKPVEAWLDAHSGFLCADLDDLGARLPEVRSKLIQDAHTFALFSSPTGDGLKVLFRIPPNADSHLDAFSAVSSHVSKLAGCDIDEQCKDVPRICFFSHDPDLHLNPLAEVFGCTHRTHSPHRTHRTHRTHNSHSSYTVGGEVEEPPLPAVEPIVASIPTVERAIASTVPKARGTSNPLIVKLAGMLKAFEKTTGTKLDYIELRKIFGKWYERGKPNLDPSEDEGDYYMRFLDAWGNAQPMTEGIVNEAWRLSENDPRPPELPKDLDTPKMIRFAAFVRRLQVMIGDRPFYLSPYTVARLFGDANHTTASVHINVLRHRNVVTRIEPGKRLKKAATYRFNLA